MLYSLIGMILKRNSIIKFFICYELFFVSVSVIMLIFTWDIYERLIILLLLWNTTFELALSLSILRVKEFFIILCVIVIIGLLVYYY